MSFIKRFSIFTILIIPKPQSIADVQRHLHEYQYVCKTDVQSFCESIDQYRLMEMINDTVHDRGLRYYLYQIIHRCIEFGGEFSDIDDGISRGCPISPLLGHYICPHLMSILLIRTSTTSAIWMTFCY